jgi:hypothetical protein
MLAGLLACQLLPAWQARMLAKQRAATQPAETV